MKGAGGTFPQELTAEEQSLEKDAMAKLAPGGEENPTSDGTRTLHYQNSCVELCNPFLAF